MYKNTKDSIVLEKDLGEIMVSVIIIAFNLERFIAEAVKSALANGVAEVIVVDDGSTDQTVAVLRGTAANDPRVQILQQDNRGSASARNTGARVAKGKYLLFLDGDDRLFAGVLSKLTDLLNNADRAVCSYGQWTAINESGKLMPPKMKLKSLYSGFVLKHILQRGFLLPGCALLRRDAFLAIGGFDENVDFAEDWEFFCRLSLEGHFLASPDYVFGYRLRGASRSAIANINRVPKILSTINMVFSNPKLKDHFSFRELSRLKKISRACAILGISTRDFWDGHIKQSLSMAILAIGEHPPILPRVLVRLGLNTIMLYSPKVLNNWQYIDVSSEELR